MSKSVVIDCFPESAARYGSDYAIVVVDVLRATTTAVTAAAGGRRCFTVPTIEAAAPIAARLENPLLAGEVAGVKPRGFEINNSPAELAARTDVERAMILLSTSGTKLIDQAKHAAAVYAACLRNHTAQVEELVGNHDNVAVIGAGTREEFRIEDQIGCAWIARGLIERGYEAEDENTAQLVERWKNASVGEILGDKSAAYLRASSQHHDLDFVLEHVDDLNAAFRVEHGEILAA
jgi:2-phosphosulfolactate phosphatase